MKNEETKEIVPITNDKMFFHIMHTQKEYLTNLIHYITKIPLEELKKLEYIDTTLSENNKEKKHERSDIVVKAGNYIINLEMNKHYYKELILKNFSYLCLLNNSVNMEGEEYDLNKKFIQINFDCFNNHGKDLKNKYILEEGIYKEKYPLQRMEIYHIVLDYLQNKEYTESENNKLLDYLKIMLLKDKTEILEIGKTDEILKGVGEEMIRYSKKIPLGYRDVELEERILMNTYKKEGIREGEERGLIRGRAEGKTEGANDTIIKMYSGGIGKEAIANALNMPLEQLDEILKSKNNMAI